MHPKKVNRLHNLSAKINILVFYSKFIEDIFALYFANLF